MTDAREITVVDTLVIQKGRRAAFDSWFVELEAALAGHAGHEGRIVRLEQVGGTVHLLHRFASRHAYDVWVASDRQRALTTALTAFAISRSEADDHPAPRFALPGQASAPAWKRVLVSWATVFPLLLGTSYAGQALVPGWPRPLTLALSSLAITVVLNLVIFPRLNRRLEPWLLDDGQGEVRDPAG